MRARTTLDRIAGLEATRARLRSEIAELRKIAEYHRRRALELERHVSELYMTGRQLERQITPRP
jgi:phage shock protein A